MIYSIYQYFWHFVPFLLEISSFCSVFLEANVYLLFTSIYDITTCDELCCSELKCKTNKTVTNYETILPLCPFHQITSYWLTGNRKYITLRKYCMTCDPFSRPGLPAQSQVDSKHTVYPSAWCLQRSSMDTSK